MDEGGGLGSIKGLLGRNGDVSTKRKAVKRRGRSDVESY